MCERASHPRVAAIEARKKPGALFECDPVFGAARCNAAPFSALDMAPVAARAMSLWSTIGGSTKGAQWASVARLFSLPSSSSDIHPTVAATRSAGTGKLRD